MCHRPERGWEQEARVRRGLDLLRPRLRLRGPFTPSWLPGALARLNFPWLRPRWQAGPPQVNRPGESGDSGVVQVRPCQHETYVTTATQPGWNQPDQPAPAARLGWVSGKDKRYLMSWVWLGCSAVALVLVLWAKHVA